MDGFLFLDKKDGLTSRGASSEVSHLLNEKKIGHIGTLDPFATGLLVVVLGKATKAATFFDEFSKEYVATIKLGVATDSMDLTGKEIESKEVPNLSKDKINEVLHSFLDKSKQLPPMTSAVHVNGQKLYKLARRGIEVERPLRDIEVYNIELISYENNELTFKVHASKGTYIRVLASDIAVKLGTVGHLVKLRRTKVGPFDITQSFKIEEVNIDSIESVYEVLKEFSEVVTYDDKKVEDVKNGKILEIKFDTDKSKLLVIDKSHNAIAIYLKVRDNIFRFARGLF